MAYISTSEMKRLGVPFFAENRRPPPEPVEKRWCLRCGCVVAQDNHSLMCSPCLERCERVLDASRV